MEEDAERHMKDGYNCAESVLLAFIESWEKYFRSGVTSAAATAFGGGIGRSGNICGALSGGLIALGLAVGRTDAKDEEGKQQAYQAARELLQGFRKQWGALTCRELTECDLSTPEGYEKYRESKIHETKCSKIVRETTRTVAAIIDRFKKDPI
ncbi:MAG: C-GCAxxG-C-C family protein [Promethearchaeati archaeon SRVP18_Atabeyarchaeia-1]